MNILFTAYAMVLILLFALLLGGKQINSLIKVK